MRRLYFLLNIFCSSVVLGQHTNLPLGYSFNSDLNELIYDNSDEFHTSFKPLIKSKLFFSLDSIKKIILLITTLGFFVKFLMSICLS